MSVYLQFIDSKNIRSILMNVSEIIFRNIRKVQKVVSITLKSISIDVFNPPGYVGCPFQSNN